jgi:hypothetical protein
MAFRKPISAEFGNRMSTKNSSIAMHATVAKSFTTWANSDLKRAAETGDWSDLITKAEVNTRRFRNTFYK